MPTLEINYAGTKYKGKTSIACKIKFFALVHKVKLFILFVFLYFYKKKKNVCGELLIYEKIFTHD